MVLFDVRLRRNSDRAEAHGVPTGYEAVAEMLRDGRAENEALRYAGRHAADSGAGLEEALDDLATTVRTVSGSVEPNFGMVRELAHGWSDAQLNYFHSLSCEDPLTGLTSLSHIRTRLGDAYREAGRQGADVGVTLVVVDLVDEEVPMSRLDRAMRLVHVSEMLRSVFSGDETLGRLTGTRAVAVARRDDQLATSVNSLRQLLTAWSGRGGPRSRVWIEGLPPSVSGAVSLLDELARRP